MVPPDKFIPLIERAGLINIFTEMMLRKIFAIARHSLPDPLFISLNISPLQMLEATLPGLIRRVGEENAFPLRRLIVEITESALLDNLGHALAVARELKTLGIRLALDDFGKGYSSLLHLQAIPFDEIKIDRAFISSMMKEPENRKVVAAIVGLGYSLGLVTVGKALKRKHRLQC